MSRLRRFGGAVAPPLVGGVGMALSLPPFGMWILAFPAAAVLWWQLGLLGVRRRLAAGWVFGLGLYGIGLWWVTDFNVYGGLVLIVVEALAVALASAIVPRGRGRTPALAGAMVLLELARSSWPFGGLPLGGVALGQASGPLAEAARLGGPDLLVGLVWLGGGGLGAVLVTGARWTRTWWAARSEPAGWRLLTGHAPPAGVRTLGSVPVAGPVVAGVLAVAVTAGVAVAGRSAPDGGRAVSTIEVAAVQGGGVRGLDELQVPPQEVFDAQVAATELLEAGSASHPPALIVWPEDVVALDQPLAGSPEEQTVASLARAARATVLAGVTEPAGPGRFRNEIVAFAPDGDIVASYEKVHRVPFGEYVPWRGLVKHLANLSDVPEDAVAGHGDGTMRTPAGDLGTMVSYEVFFADRGRAATRGGATLLVVPTNTSSYSTAQVPTQEVAADRLQALSEGRDLVQAAPTGFSDLVDNQGRVLARSGLGHRALLVGRLSMRDGRTVYERFGDLPVLAGALAGIVGGWLWAALVPSEEAKVFRRRRLSMRRQGHS
ncbi:MAG TPA: apolipoprotein N-acyltransferase [Acidimicrobiales bacterium]|nr:apolipoprotein N-acyltransferase [Acidimicrobiales bacterium]